MDIGVTEYKWPGLMRTDGGWVFVSGEMGQVTPALKRDHLAKQTKTIWVLKWTMDAAKEGLPRNDAIVARKSRSEAVELLNIATKRAYDPELHEKT